MAFAFSGDAAYRQAVSDVQDADLVSLAQAGDEQAFTLLVARCEPMLRAQVARLRPSSADAEDMAQEGLLGLLAAVRTYRSAGGASFRTYAAVCVRNRLLSVLRRTAGQGDEASAQQAADAVMQRRAVDPETLVVEHESAAHLLARLRELLTAREYAVLLRYLDGFSYAEIATEMHSTVKAVDNALQRVRRKVRENLSVSFG